MAETAKWWENSNLDTLVGKSAPYDGSFILPLVIHALRGGPTVTRTRCHGYLPEGLEADDLFKALNGFSFILVYRDNNSYMYRNKDTDTIVYLSIEGNCVEVSACSSGTDVSLEVKKAIAPLLVSNPRHGVRALVQEGQELTLKKIGEITSNLIRDNYDPQVIEGYDYIQEQLSSDAPSGRLAILNGQPGTGKTHLLKGLIASDSDCDFILISPSVVRDIAGPNLLSIFRHDTGKKRVLVLEDADACLAKRAADTMSDIQALLNLADGIIGQVMDFRIVATTNAKKLDFDPAIMRPGRLCGHIEVDLLQTEQANRVYQRVSEKTDEPFSKEVTLAAAYAKANAVRPIKPTGPKPIGFVTEHEDLVDQVIYDDEDDEDRMVACTAKNRSVR